MTSDVQMFYQNVWVVGISWRFTVLAAFQNIGRLTFLAKYSYIQTEQC